MDILAYAKRLRAAGVSEEQAKAHAKALREATEPNLVTQQHLDKKIAELKGDLLQWMFGIAAGQIALLIVAPVKLL